MMIIKGKYGMVFGTLLSIGIFISCQRDIEENTPESPDNIRDFGKVVLFYDTLRIYDANSGAVVAQNNNDILNRGSQNNCLAINDGVLYEPTIQNMIAIKIDNGALKFKKYLGTAVYDYNVSSFPSFEGNRMYVSSGGSSTLFCFNKDNGDIIWISTFTQCVDVAPYYTTPLVAGDKIITTAYLGSTGDIRRAVYCVDKNTGSLLWSKVDYSLGKLHYFPFATGNKVFLANDSKIFCLDISTGVTLWEKPMVGIINRPFGFVNGNLVFQTYNNSGFELQYLDINTSSIVKSVLHPNQTLVHFDGTSYFTKTWNYSGPWLLSRYDCSSNQNAWEKSIVRDFEWPNISDNYIYLNLCNRLLILDKHSGDSLHTTALDRIICKKMFVIDSAGRGVETFRSSIH